MEIKIGQGLTDKKKQAIFNDLFLLLNSGLDIKRALELIAEEQKKKKDKKVIEGIYNNIINGDTLSESLEKSKLFTNYECVAVQIGETSGELLSVLSYLKTYYDKKIEQRRQITSALAYPVLVLFVAVGAVLFMIGFVVPTFADTFKKFKIDLPWITKFVIGLSNQFDVILITIILLISIGILLFQVLKKNDMFLSLKEKFLLKLPVFGSIIHLGIISQFTQAMTLLINARTPIVQSMQLVASMTSSHGLRKALKESESKVLQGEFLSTCLSSYNLFPKRMIYMMKVGEEVNQLGNIFNELNTLYTAELEHKSKMLNTVIEPILIIFLGFVVGFILIAMYLPMFSITDMLGK
jgi:type IV pilus assembly protein PilC